MKFRVWSALFLVVGAVSGCSGSTSAVIDTMRSVVRRDEGANDARLNPNFRYLRVTVGRRSALLVLGYVEPHAQGPIEVWYSAEREVIRLQNGRVVGAVGLTTEWRNVVLVNPPSWLALSKASSTAQLARLRDTMPGYRYGLRETLQIVATPPPARSALQSLDIQELAWFEETAEPETAGATRRNLFDEDRLPVARYAVAFDGGNANVVYGEQCLSRDLCFSWQRWPGAPLNAKADR